MHRQTCVRRSRQLQRGEGGGRIASRGRFVPLFLLGNKWENLLFSRGGPDPLPPSVSAHIRVSNLLNSHFLFILLVRHICWAWSIHKTSANYISWRQRQRQHDSSQDQRDRSLQLWQYVVLGFGVARDGFDARKCT